MTVERCTFCEQVHDTGRSSVLGITIKTCDVLPPGSIYIGPEPITGKPPDAPSP